MAEEFTIPDDDWDAPLEEEDQFQLPTSAAWQNLNAASQGNPDAYAKDRDLSKRTGVPIEAINDNRDEIVKKDAVGLISDEDWNKPLTESENPGVAKYLEDPEAAQLSFDDISILTAIENESKRSWFDVDTRVLQGLGDSMMIGMGKTQDELSMSILNEMRRGGDEHQALMASQNVFGWGMRKIRDSVMLDLPGDVDDDVWNEEIDRRIEAHKQNLEFAEGMVAELTPEDLSVVEEGVRGGFQMGADLAPGLAISIGTRGKVNPTLGYLTGKTYLSSYGSAIIGGKDHDVATQYASIDAALEYATERLPTKRLEALFGAGGNGVKSSIKKWLLQEAGTEQIATATQTINAYAHELDEDLAAAQGWEEVLEIQGRRQAVTFISTLVGGGGMAASIKGVDYLSNREQRAMGKIIQKTNKRRGAEFEQERLDNLIHLAQASKTNERAADMFEQFMGNAAPDQQVFMSAEAVDLLNDAPGYILEQMDGSGGDVVIPLATFLKDFANDETKLELVRPFIKTAESLSTKKELEEDHDSEYIKTLLAKANEATETKTAADEIYERITAQLVATGRQSEATSRQSAEIITAQVTTQYEYLQSVGFKKEDGSEVTLEELFADFGLEIVGPEVDVGASDFMTQGPESEYDQAVAKGLPMDQISRLTRARDMGFDVDQTYYHYTDAEDFSGFRPLSHFGSQESANDRMAFLRSGDSLDVNETSPGVFEVQDGDMNTYATAESDAEAREMMNEIAREDAVLPMNEDERVGGGRSIPVYVNVKNPLRIKDSGANHSITQEIMNAMASTKAFTQQEVNEYPVRPDQGPSRNDVINLMKSRGYDGFIYKNTVEGAGTESVVPLEPHQVRSVNAAFDPDYTGSDQMLAQAGMTRMERAEHLGFDTENVFYHGTNQKFDAFDNEKALDGAHFFTPNQAHAEVFERGAGGTTGAYYLRTENPMEITQDDLEAAWDEAHPNWQDDDFETDLLPRDYVIDFVEKARELGHDSLVIRDFADVDFVEDVVLPLDPSQVRSVDAEFNINESKSPRVFAQQDFGNIAITETVLDEDGMPVDITESANAMWKEQQRRQANLDVLRRCSNG